MPNSKYWPKNNSGRPGQARKTLEFKNRLRISASKPNGRCAAASTRAARVMHALLAPVRNVCARGGGEQLAQVGRRVCACRPHVCSTHAARCACTFVQHVLTGGRPHARPIRAGGTVVCAQPCATCTHGYRPVGATPAGQCTQGVRDRCAMPAAPCVRDALGYPAMHAAICAQRRAAGNFFFLKNEI
ncbi:tRNA-specific adenosine deaminase [Dorcoceras hygrometricum]|uniref:tRNA-specific adenosine deaminase n=1 Tax=Dorcoceras hygrometricum TaxID=472368 RepID=A0A2Z7ABW7_9LAMI|nr:tRNA-specific adenosine deaminase [Dorcoceras hygrometricum]